MENVGIQRLLDSTPATFTHLKKSAARYADNVLSESTRVAYGKLWKTFEAWATENSLTPLPVHPDSLGLYLAWQADRGLRPATLNLSLCAIGWMHKLAGHPSPVTGQVRALLLGIRRTVGSAPNKKAPLLVNSLRAIFSLFEDDLRGRRDRALFLVGFGAALRRSELVALRVEDVQFDGEVLRVLIRRSKTDQEGLGQTITVSMGRKLETCPVRSLRAWLKAAGIESGPIFRAITRAGRLESDALSPWSVAAIIKTRAAAAGLDAKTFSGHSLRRGLVTQAAKAGKDQWTIMAQSRHKSVDVMRGYIQDAELTRNNASKDIGL